MIDGKDAAYIVPNPTGPTVAVIIEPEVCVGCNACVNICRIQALLPNPERGKPPILAYPDECWYCGCCVEACRTGALQMRLPINQRLFFKRRETGEVFRLGADDSPPKSYFKPPSGHLCPDEERRAGRGDVRAVWSAISHKTAYVAAAVSPFAAAEFSSAFAETFPAPEGGEAGKLAAALRRIGFDAVCAASAGLAAACRKRARELGKDAFVVSVLPCAAEAQALSVEEKALPVDDADAILTADEVAEMFRIACVSRFTARTEWRRLPEEPFDAV